MDNFAKDMACVVRQLFPADENVGANNKRKRSSSLCPMGTSPLREIRNHSNNISSDKNIQGRRLSDEGNLYNGTQRRREHIRSISIQKRVFSANESSESSSAEGFLNSVTNILNDRYPSDTDHLVIREAAVEDRANGRIVPLNSVRKEQIETIRVMMIPPKRKDTMKRMEKMILGSNFDQKHPRYGPGFWHSVLRSYSSFKKIYIAEKHIKERFDLLFGFTYCLSKHRRWLTHNARGWGGEKMVAGLALRWKHLLKYSPEQMGLDEEYSYPALMHLVEDFKIAVESVETYGNPTLQFEYI